MLHALNGRRGLGFALVGLGLLTIAIYFVQTNPSVPPAQVPTATMMIVATAMPTAMPTAMSTATPTATPAPTPTATSTLIPAGYLGPLVPTAIGRATPGATTTASPTTSIATRSVATISTTVSVAPAAASDVQRRICIGVPYGSPLIGDLNELRPGWYLDWGVAANPPHLNNIEFAQMVRLSQGKPAPDVQTLAKIARKNPGALWLVGNEMDVKWQDNTIPEQYATVYHDVYAALKQADPTSRIAIGGVTEPSPLRLRYLDRVLQAYRDQYGQEMPVDVWNMHNFILPEQSGSWGVDIPPGINETQGLTYGIADHDRLDIFKQQIVDFRRWMAERGYRDKELLITEYGILMYPEYGFDHARVRDFMLGTFDLMNTATDPGLGLPSDGNRLVQRWCWFSLGDVNYPTGNLLDPATGNLTPLGRDFKQYIDTHP